MPMPSKDVRVTLEEPFSHLEDGGDFEVGRTESGMEFEEYMLPLNVKGNFPEAMDEAMGKAEKFWSGTMANILPKRGIVYWRTRPKVVYRKDKNAWMVYARFHVEET